MSRTALGLGLGVTSRRGEAAAAGEPSEFITNGALAVDANWTKGSGWGISGGVATYAAALGGALSQNFGALVQPLVNGNSYRITIDLDNPGPDMVTIVLTGGAGSQTIFNSPVDGPNKTATFAATDARTTIAISCDAAPISVDNVRLGPL